MMRMVILVSAAGTAIGSIATMTASPPARQSPRIVTQTADGKPIMLGTMRVTATALPNID